MPPEAAPLAAALAPPTSLYIHIPWCVKKCPYCDFNSHALKSGLPEKDYVATLLADLDADLARFPEIQERPITSVFFGGGTPSLFSAESIRAILDGARQRMRFAVDAEVTLETNPGTAEHGRFEGYLAAGVNRISFGVQSFDDAALARIGRIHGADEARRAVRMAQDAGIRRINLDLMYALPRQTLAAALYDVDEALELDVEHISHYQLTLEPNTLFAARPPKLPDEDAAWDMQDACIERLALAGHAQYEVSAYARPGARCRHNVNYWEFGDYLGIGAGAHGKLSLADGRIVRPVKLRHPQAYLDAAGRAERLSSCNAVTTELPFEFMLNALRLVDGFAVDLIPERTGLSLADFERPLATAFERDWLTRSGERIVPTEFGRRFLNDVIELFL